MVVALHACDTATDGAVAAAGRAEASVLLCVPCCHKDLNARLRGEGAASPLRPIFRHGILGQRQADLVTDAISAFALRIIETALAQSGSRPYVRRFRAKLLSRPCSPSFRSRTPARPTSLASRL